MQDGAIHVYLNLKCVNHKPKRIFLEAKESTKYTLGEQTRGLSFTLTLIFKTSFTPEDGLQLPEWQGGDIVYACRHTCMYNRQENSCTPKILILVLTEERNQTPTPTHAVVITRETEQLRFIGVITINTMHSKLARSPAMPAFYLKLQLSR